MQALINLITGFIALLASMALAQFGVDLQTPRGVERHAEREVHHTADCATAHPGDDLAASSLVNPARPRC